MAHYQELRLSLSFARLTLAVLVLVSAIVIEPRTTAAQTSQSEINAVLSTFYHWYLEALTKDQLPLSNDRTKMELYVSTTLLQEIDKRISSPQGMDEDYFTKAQDYLEDWSSNILVSDIQIVAGNAASAIVTLGATKESKHRLAVSLVHEGNVWKISKVSEPSPPKTKPTKITR
jgi:hypothetical protein